MKLMIAVKDTNDMFIFEEKKDGKAPIIRARANDLETLLYEVGKIADIDIEVTDYFGDYVYDVLKESRKDRKSE